MILYYGKDNGYVSRKFRKVQGLFSILAIIILFKTRRTSKPILSRKWSISFRAGHRDSPDPILMKFLQVKRKEIEKYCNKNFLLFSRLPASSIKTIFVLSAQSLFRFLPNTKENKIRKQRKKGSVWLSLEALSPSSPQLSAFEESRREMEIWRLW